MAERGKQRARVETIGPDEAAKLLEHDKHNRPLSPPTVERYAVDMRNDAWRRNGETIKIDWDGNVQDGQHRLWAVIESGATIETWVVRGCDPADFTTIDRGKIRNIRDAVAVHEGQASPTLSASLRWLWKLDHYGMRLGYEPTHADVLEYLGDHPDVRESCAVADSYRGLLLPRGSVAAMHFAAWRVSDRDAADNFVAYFANGSDLVTGDAILVLRERLFNDVRRGQRRTQVEKMALVGKSWNIWRGKAPPLRQLMWRKDEPFPTFL